MFTMLAGRYRQNRSVRKTVLIYLAVTIGCVVFDRIYAIFGHGVYSAAMSLMFLYPLLGGVLPFMLLGLLLPQADQARLYRFSANAYHSGIATLTIGSLLTGILQIAGTASPYLIGYSVTGWSLLVIGLSIYLASLLVDHSCRPWPDSRNP